MKKFVNNVLAIAIIIAGIVSGGRASAQTDLDQKKSILQLKTESDAGADQVIGKSSITLHMCAGISAPAFV